MSFGLLVKNQNAAAQIDATYRELGVKSFGIATVNPSTYVYYISGVNSQSNNGIVGYPIVMLKPTANGVWRMPYTGDLYGAGTDLAIVQAGFLQPVKYVVLDITDSPLSIPGASNWGMRVFNASGLTVFDSRKRRFFLDQITYISLPANFTTYDFSLPAPEFGERYFQALVRGRGGESGDDPGVIISQLSATTYRIEARRQYWEDPGAGAYIISGYFSDT